MFLEKPPTETGANPTTSNVGIVSQFSEEQRFKPALKDLATIHGDYAEYGVLQLESLMGAIDEI
ncbi:12836_t:CDS:2, partial [Racocetra persica]